MKDLLKFNWEAFDYKSGLKVAIGGIVVFGLSITTRESWIATGLVLLFAWLSNIPGTLKDRITGMSAFAIGAIVFTLLSGQIELSLWSNVLGIALTGFLGSLLLIKGMRAFMVGYVIICWAIYSPFLISSTSVSNCILAILVGTGVLIFLSVIASFFEKPKIPVETTESSTGKTESNFIFAYSITIALVLGVGTYIGWSTLKTDPTLVTGAAFFVMGFDAKKTKINGIARVIGILAGMILGWLLSKNLEPGLVFYSILLLALFLSFATEPVHPGFLMFFFMVLISMGWQGLDNSKIDLNFYERLLGEGTGVLIAIVAIGFLQWLQSRIDIKKSR